MRFITFENDKAQTVGVLNKKGDKAADINSFGLSKNFIDMNDFLENSTKNDMDLLNEKLDFSDGVDVAELKLLAPIPRPKHDIICLGLNYTDHIKELHSNVPKHPVFFGKRSAQTSGHEGVVCGSLDVDEQFDYESELAVIIGKQCKNVKAENVEDYIFGYTILNDFTSRRLQKEHSQWFLGKSGDGFASMGPWIVTKDELPMPLNLNISSRINGEIRQNSNTEYFMFDISTIIETLTRTVTLEPGDIVSTGTPGGVGAGMNPPTFLKKGDVVQCEVEYIGILKSIVG